MNRAHILQYEFQKWFKRVEWRTRLSFVKYYLLWTQLRRQQVWYCIYKSFPSYSKFKYFRDSLRLGVCESKHRGMNIFIINWSVIQDLYSTHWSLDVSCHNCLLQVGHCTAICAVSIISGSISSGLDKILRFICWVSLGMLWLLVGYKGY